jgi:hypothetical protein
MRLGGVFILERACELPGAELCTALRCNLRRGNIRHPPSKSVSEKEFNAETQRRKDAESKKATTEPLRAVRGMRLGGAFVLERACELPGVLSSAQPSGVI